MAAARAEGWRGRLVIHIGDKQNVKSWLDGRAPNNEVARVLVRIYNFLEVAYNFQTIAAYARTYHNVTTDFGALLK